jgi:hypothetical protein
VTLGEVEAVSLTVDSVYGSHLSRHVSMMTVSLVAHYLCRYSNYEHHSHGLTGRLAASGMRDPLPLKKGVGKEGLARGRPVSSVRRKPGLRREKQPKNGPQWPQEGERCRLDGEWA